MTTHATEKVSLVFNKNSLFKTNEESEIFIGLLADMEMINLSKLVDLMNFT